MLAGAQALAVSDMDSLVGQVPLDPFITLGLITFSCGGVGWLLGPIVGTGIFNTMNRKYIPDMAAVRTLWMGVTFGMEANLSTERSGVL
jgi:hypothetical protein